MIGSDILDGEDIAVASPENEGGGAPERGAPRGRPRSEAVERAILDAVVELIVGGESIDNLSMEAVAAKAGVGKATIYRRWPNKEELLLEALGSQEPIPEPSGGTVREKLRIMLAAIADPARFGMRQLFNARCYAVVASEGNRNPTFKQRYKDEVVEPRRRMMREVLAKGIDSGELRPDTDIDLMQQMVMASLIHRLIAMQPGDRLPTDHTDRLVEALFEGFGARKT